LIFLYIGFVVGFLYCIVYDTKLFCTIFLLYWLYMYGSQDHDI